MNQYSLSLVPLDLPRSLRSTGFFILTPHYGLDYIAQCRQSGFHPHPNDPPLFMEAQHIKMDSKAKIKVIDLRR